MKKRLTPKDNELWLKAFGKRLEKLILSQGYNSAYDFWIHTCGNEISRATLNNMLIGKMDIKVGTLRKLAHLLEIPLIELLNVEENI